MVGFTVEEEQYSKKTVIVFIFLAYFFNILVRYVYVDYISGAPQFFWHNAIMINTNDGYYWLEGARDILNGVTTKAQAPIDSFVSNLIVLISKIFFFIPFETLIFYLPGFLSSLIVIPIILIARAMKLTYVGFLSALLAGMVWSYYHRTMFGYLDTDMLILVFPLFSILFIIKGLQQTKGLIFFGLASITEVLMVWWHHGLININHATFLLLLCYLLWKKDLSVRVLYIGILFFLPLLKLPVLFSLGSIIAVILVDYFFHSSNQINLLSKKIQNQKKLYYGIIFSFLFVYLITKGIDFGAHFIHNVYVDRSITNNDIFNFHYYSVLNTVREAGHIDYDTIVHRMSGSWLGFLVGLIGYFILTIRKPLFIFFLPLLAIGFFTIQGGLRFTIFAVPVLALGNGYIAYFIGKVITSKFFKKKELFYLVSLAIMGLFIYPNYKHIHKYIVPSVFTNKEVAVLDKLKSIASQKDYAIAWWDYGYPIRYYSHVKTLVDGAQHSGQSNFPVSFSLTKDQISGANMARLDVEYKQKAQMEKFHSSIVQEMKDYGFKNPDKFLKALSSKDFLLPQKTRDIYFILPNRMLDILPTVSIFSNIDLLTGKIVKRPFFYQAKRFQERGNLIDLGHGIVILKDKGLLKMGKQIAQIAKFVVTSYDAKGKLHIAKQVLNPTSNLNVIYMRNYNRFLVLDDTTYNSTFIQLYVLENYDKDLYEPVILDPLIKIYKLKR